MAHTLLLADDSATIQRVVELTFASEDIDVVTVGDGTRAIEAIERDEPDIVLLDVSMPGRDGYEVASFVRSDPARDRIPVVLLTGAFEPLDESRCDAIGRHEVLVKPFEPRQVIGKVRELLELSPADAAEAPAVDAAAKALATDPSETVDTAAFSAETVEAAETAAAVEVAETADAEAVVPDASVADAAAPADASAPAREAAAAAPTEATPVEQVASVPSGPPASTAETAAEVGESTAPLSGEAVSGAGVRIPPPGAGGSVLAEAFSTFLAVEQGADPPALAAADTGADAGNAGPELQVPDAMIDELVERVVERMSETVVRDTVAEVVSRIGERLAREEGTRVTSGGE